MTKKIIITRLLAFGATALICVAPVWAAKSWSSHTPATKMTPLEQDMWMAGCLKTKSDMKQTCVQTLCVKKAKDITGKLICAKQACQRIKETKDISCVQWGKPRAQKRGERK